MFFLGIFRRRRRLQAMRHEGAITLHQIQIGHFRHWICDPRPKITIPWNFQLHPSHFQTRGCFSTIPGFCVFVYYPL